VRRAFFSCARLLRRSGRQANELLKSQKPGLRHGQKPPQDGPGPPNSLCENEFATNLVFLKQVSLFLLSHPYRPLTAPYA
jgi:hypothetical protein